MKQIKLCFLTIIFFAISNCAPTSIIPVNAPTEYSTILNKINSEKILGQIIDIDGIPISKATVLTETNQTQSDDQGRFELPSSSSPQWVTVKKSGYISRTRAAGPGIPILIRVSPDDGKTIVFNFAGDVMLGRRFFDPNEDGDPSDGLLPINPSIEDHLNLLASIKPLLENSDITAVNLESVIDVQPYFSPRDTRPSAYHPTKNYVYATHPNAIDALEQSGINVVGIGNNHVYDMLEQGMTNTIADLDNAGMPHFGAGMNETEAWAPVYMIIKEQKVAFIACTTIYGNGGIADGNEITYVADDVQNKGGAAFCEKNKLQKAVTEAKQNADIVVVMIHGGFEYERSRAGNPILFTKIAKQAGATIIINHHPHVVGGFTWENNSIVGWSFGNFISDQTVWPSFESYMLTVYVRDGEIIRAFVEPVILNNFITEGLTNELADYVVRGAAGREPGPFVVESGAMEVDINHTVTTTTTTETWDGREGTIIAIPQEKWLSGYKGEGSLLLGRDLMWVGNFENSATGNMTGDLPLWKQNEPSNVKVGKDFAYEGQVGIRLSRGSGNQSGTVTTNLHRILVNSNSKLTISGVFRGSQGAVSSLQVSWYPDTTGASSSQEIQELTVITPDVWQPFHLNVQVPQNIVALGVFLKLSPPISGISTADFDNIRVIEWAPTNTPYNILYNYAYLIGFGELTFSQAVLPGGEKWMMLTK